MRPGGAVVQPCQSFSAISISPLANGPRADACAFGDGLRRLPALHLPNNPLSTARREPGILMHVHPVSPRNLKLQQPQLPRSKPDGQPTESSKLSRACTHKFAMSALPRKADIGRHDRDVRFVPIAGIGLVSSPNERPRRHAGFFI